MPTSFLWLIKIMMTINNILFPRVAFVSERLVTEMSLMNSTYYLNASGHFKSE